MNIEKKTIKAIKIINSPEVIDEVIDSFSRTTDEIFSLEELKKLLLSGKQLVMKYGVDVTAPDIHIGHAVNLWMYRRLQELGHKAVFLIGDFTTQIGDPTGRNKTRPIISEREIERNSQMFIKQAMMVLRKEKNLFEVKRNSEWYNRMQAKELLSLMSMVTNERLLSREMFRKRIKEKAEIYEHELIYPILQGYDSVMLKADLTIIGTDQLYNEMMGRFFQEKFSQPSQVIITTKITPGIDGREKQSKSWGNYIGLNHSPREKFGRIMSIADNLIIEYLKVYTEIPLKDITQIEKDLDLNPMKYKFLLAKEIVRRYHGEKTAKQEEEWFKKTFSRGEIPKDSPKMRMGIDTATILQILRKCFSVKEMSNSDLRRLIKQGGVKVNGNKVQKPEENIRLEKEEIEIKAGKRNWFKVVK